MILYRYDFAQATVVPVECPEPSYPHADADGHGIYENTHFRSEAEAWTKLVRECEASLSLGASERARIRAKLEAITTELADDAERLVKAKAGAEAYAERAAKDGAT